MLDFTLLIRHDEVSRNTSDVEHSLEQLSRRLWRSVFVQPRKRVRSEVEKDRSTAPVLINDNDRSVSRPTLRRAARELDCRVH